MRSIKDITRRKEAIMKQYAIPFVHNEKSLAVSVVELQTIIEKMQEMAKSKGFRSRKKEVAFYTKDLTATLASYWFLSEMGLLCSTMPLNQTLQTDYLDQKWAYYCNFKSQYYQQYMEYCAVNEGGDWQSIKACFTSKDPAHSVVFFDPAFDFLFTAYFTALDLILQQLEYLMNPSFLNKSPSLRWHGTKVDLSLLIYALYELNKKDKEKASLVEWTNAFEKLFNIEISKNFHQTLSAFMNRKNIDHTIITQLDNIIRTRYLDIG